MIQEVNAIQLVHQDMNVLMEPAYLHAIQYALVAKCAEQIRYAAIQMEVRASVPILEHAQYARTMQACAQIVVRVLNAGMEEFVRILEEASWIRS